MLERTLSVHMLVVVLHAQIQTTDVKYTSVRIMTLVVPALTKAQIGVLVHREGMVRSRSLPLPRRALCLIPAPACTWRKWQLAQIQIHTW